MSVYEDNWYDVTVECRYCHQLYDTRIQLFSEREVALARALLLNIFTHCHNCFSTKEQFSITVSNQYYTAEECNQMFEDKSKKTPPPGD